jgi:phosphoribosyl 1,2-cyclic phosphodiesterase
MAAGVLVAMTVGTNHERSKLEQDAANHDQKDRPRLIFLGTGSSTGCPKPVCVLKMPEQGQSAPATSSSSSSSMQDSSPCQVSMKAVQGDPKSNKDYRNNPSLLVQHYDASTRSYKNIVIDTGKTFRETALRWFPKFGIKSLDAIVLTHHHMDAAAGLDDVRGFQPVSWIADPFHDGNRSGKPSKDGVGPTTPNSRPVRDPLPLYLSQFCLINLQSQFPWLLPNPNIIMPKQDNNRPHVERDVAAFDAVVFKDYETEPFFAHGEKTGQGGEAFQITPLPVWHGDDLISHGFAFTLHPRSPTEKAMNVVYLSDISRMVPETLEFVQNKLPPTDILIVDSLLWHKKHPVHFSLDQAVELAKHIQPRLQTYLIGMSCDAFLPHEEMNEYLRQKYDGKIVMAHDGLVIGLPQKSDTEIKRESLHRVVEKRSIRATND